MCRRYSPQLRAPPQLTTEGKPVEPPQEKTFIQKYWIYMVVGLLALGAFWRLCHPVIVAGPYTFLDIFAHMRLPRSIPEHSMFCCYSHYLYCLSCRFSFWMMVIADSMLQLSLPAGTRKVKAKDRYKDKHRVAGSADRCSSEAPSCVRARSVAVRACRLRYPAIQCSRAHVVAVCFANMLLFGHQEGCSCALCSMWLFQGRSAPAMGNPSADWASLGCIGKA